MTYAILFFYFLIIACGNSSQDFEAIVEHQKYPLIEWPDSVYIASLDSILKLEPVKKEKDENQTEITLKTSSLMSSVPTPVPAKQQSKASSKTTATSSPPSISFANRFMKTLEVWQSDPANPSLYISVKANDNEDLYQLIQRHYKKSTVELPKFYTTSTLQSLNPGVSVEHLKSGDMVRLPRF
ncbi:MAG: hypothetical protein GX116_04100 [Fibrobacter sp.]|nr:hypothetical protein [Fibrobacter sp.]